MFILDCIRVLFDILVKTSLVATFLNCSPPFVSKYAESDIIFCAIYAKSHSKFVNFSATLVYELSDFDNNTINDPLLADILFIQEKLYILIKVFLVSLSAFTKRVISFPKIIIYELSGIPEIVVFKISKSLYVLTLSLIGSKSLLDKSSFVI
jgi:hypothetical protein